MWIRLLPLLSLAGCHLLIGHAPAERDGASDRSSPELSDRSSPELSDRSSPELPDPCAPLTTCGGVCVDTQTNPQHCGGCNACPTKECSKATCEEGRCGTSPLSNEVCTGGVCVKGDCCTTCVKDGGGCVESTPATCGAGGNPCMDCTTWSFQPCQDAVCLPSGKCDAEPRLCAPGQACLPQHDACCACISGGKCIATPDADHCGINGQECKPCNSGSECKSALCDSSGSCTVGPNLVDGAPCSNGKGQCLQGVCCEGCWDKNSQACKEGSEDAFCGVGGTECQDCKMVGYCMNGACVN